MRFPPFDFLAFDATERLAGFAFGLPCGLADGAMLGLGSSSF
jgi:hypothetical protein